MTLRDFHRMPCRRCGDAIINLGGELDTQLAIDLLERRHSIDMICYFNIEVDYWPFPQKMVKDNAWKARAFLLYILGAYFFANEG